MSVKAFCQKMCDRANQGEEGNRKYLARVKCITRDAQLDGPPPSQSTVDKAKDRNRMPNCWVEQ